MLFQSFLFFGEGGNGDRTKNNVFKKTVVFRKLSNPFLSDRVKINCGSPLPPEMVPL